MLSESWAPDHWGMAISCLRSQSRSRRSKKPGSAVLPPLGFADVDEHVARVGRERFVGEGVAIARPAQEQRPVRVSCENLDAALADGRPGPWLELVRVRPLIGRRQVVGDDVYAAVLAADTPSSRCPRPAPRSALAGDRLERRVVRAPRTRSGARTPPAARTPTPHPAPAATPHTRPAPAWCVRPGTPADTRCQRHPPRAPATRWTLYARVVLPCSEDEVADG